MCARPLRTAAAQQVRLQITRDRDLRPLLLLLLLVNVRSGTLLIPQEPFELLVRRSIGRLTEPSLNCKVGNRELRALWGGGIGWPCACRWRL